ncbi:unnamed protein product [Schistosoma bovis]|nr:unnamed protein product [Schistosoma bovis]
MSTIYLMGTTDKCYVFIINANHVNLLQRLQCLVYGNIYWVSANTILMKYLSPSESRCVI